MAALASCNAAIFFTKNKKYWYFDQRLHFLSNHNQIFRDA